MPITETWYLGLKLMHRPACPRCGAYLHQEAVRFRWNVSWCCTCADSLDDDSLECVQAIRHQLVTRHITITKGLIWYTPRPPVYHAIPLVELISRGGLPNAEPSSDYN